MGQHMHNQDNIFKIDLHFSLLSILDLVPPKSQGYTLDILL